MDNSPNIKNLHNTFAIGVAFSVVLWWFINRHVLSIGRLLTKFGLPKSLFEPHQDLSHIIEPGFKSSSLWKYENILFSYTHVLVSGPLAVIFFILVYVENKNLDILDATQGTAPSSTFLAYFALLTIANSVGYFIVDFLQLLFPGGGLTQWPHLIHHLIFPGVTALCLKNFVLIYLLMLVLLVEWSNIFLHPRNLAKINKVDQSAKWHRQLKLINFYTYVSLRILTHGFFTWYIFTNRVTLTDLIGLPGWLFLAVAMSFLNFIIIVFISRLWKSDVCGRQSDMENDMGG